MKYNNKNHINDFNEFWELVKITSKQTGGIFTAAYNPEAKILISFETFYAMQYTGNEIKEEFIIEKLENN